MLNQLISQLKNKKVLLQFSGGKDSACCLVLLKNAGIDVECIHFTHRWGYELPTEEAKRLCSDFNVKLTLLDVSEDLEKLLLSHFNGRPCRFCKGILDKKTLEYAIKNDIDYICVGDTHEDKTLINRLNAQSKQELYINKYFNKNVLLPDSISIVRPLIEKSEEEIFAYLAKNNVHIKRVNDTGDKYFDYSREGCPLQFKDFGEEYTLSLLEDLKKYNKLCSNFATSKGIRASIHMPSKFIVTIPRGYEEELRFFLENNGLSMDLPKINSLKLFRYIITSRCSKEILNDENILKELLKRFCERLNMTQAFIEVLPDFFIVEIQNGKMTGQIDRENNYININIAYRDKIPKGIIENLIIEILHTYNYQISEIEESI